MISPLGQMIGSWFAREKRRGATSGTIVVKVDAAPLGGICTLDNRCPRRVNDSRDRRAVFARAFSRSSRQAVDRGDKESTITTATGDRATRRRAGPDDNRCRCRCRSLLLFAVAHPCVALANATTWRDY